MKTGARTAPKLGPHHLRTESHHIMGARAQKGVAALMSPSSLPLRRPMRFRLAALLMAAVAVRPAAATCGCMDPTGIDYNPAATSWCGCTYGRPGCTDSNSVNYASWATTDDGSCVPRVVGCMDRLALSYDSLANTDEPALCTFAQRHGCMVHAALNYDSLAVINDGSCVRAPRPASPPPCPGASRPLLSPAPPARLVIFIIFVRGHALALTRPPPSLPSSYSGCASRGAWTRSPTTTSPMRTSPAATRVYAPAVPTRSRPTSTPTLPSTM